MNRHILLTHPSFDGHLVRHGFVLCLCPLQSPPQSHLVPRQPWWADTGVAVFGFDAIEWSGLQKFTIWGSPRPSPPPGAPEGAEPTLPSQHKCPAPERGVPVSAGAVDVSGVETAVRPSPSDSKSRTHHTHHPLQWMPLEKADMGSPVPRFTHPPPGRQKQQADLHNV